MIAEIARPSAPGSTSCRKKAAADLFNSQQNELIEAARAHAELLQWEAFTRCARAGDRRRARKQVLTWLRDLFGLGLIEKHLAWYLINGRLSPQRAQAVTRVHRPADHAPPPARRRPGRRVRLRAGARARVDRDRRRGASARTEARAYYAELRASGNAPVEEKSLKTKKR